MNADWMKTRQTKFSAYASVYVLVILGVLGAINYLANRHNKSFDATSNKTYSLSDQTEKIVKGLKQDVKLRFFGDVADFGRAKDLLDRYNTLGGKLSIEYIDVMKKPLEVKQAGVKSTGTLLLESGSRREEARGVSEEEITGAIIRVIKEGQKMVCAVLGSGEHSFDESGPDGYSTLKEQLEKNNYKTKSIKLLETATVPADCSMIVVGGPKFDYIAPAIKAIQQFVENGGDALILLDSPLKIGKTEVAENAELAKVLESWGVAVNKDLTLDTSGIGRVFGLNAAIPLVVAYETHPVVNTMKDIATAFPYARSVDPKDGGKTKPDKLMSTTENSFAITNLTGAEVEFKEGRDKKGPVNLGVAGELKAPADSNKIGDGKGRFIVVGSSSWISNQLWRFPGNKDLLFNMVNWLSADEDLISIRPKDPADRRLNMNQNQMTMLFWLSVVILPLIVVGSGVSMWWRRR